MCVPVIISDCIDPGPEFTEGRDGIIFPTGDSPRLVSALQQFRENISDFNHCWSAVDHEKEWGSLSRKIVDKLNQQHKYLRQHKHLEPFGLPSCAATPLGPAPITRPSLRHCPNQPD